MFLFKIVPVKLLLIHTSMYISSQSPNHQGTDWGVHYGVSLLNQDYCIERSKIHGGRRRMKANRQHNITVGLWRSD